MSFSAGQFPFPIDQTYVYVPAPEKLTDEVGLNEEVTAGEDPNGIQVPVPIDGVFPFNVPLYVHNVWSTPALETLGLEYVVTTTVSSSDGQVANVTDQT